METSNIIKSNMIASLRFVRSESRQVADDLRFLTGHPDPMKRIADEGVSLMAAKRAVADCDHYVDSVWTRKSDREVVIDAIRFDLEWRRDHALALAAACEEWLDDDSLI